MQAITLCPGPRWVDSVPGASKSAIISNQTSPGLICCRRCEHHWRQDENEVTCPRCEDNSTETIRRLGPLSKGFCLNTVMKRREEDIVSEKVLGGDKDTRIGPILRTLKSNSLVEDLGLSPCSRSPHYSLTSLVPLDQCILAIIWEIAEDPTHLSSLSIFNRGSEETRALENLVILLRSAALYQAKLETVRSPIDMTFLPAKRTMADQNRIRTN
jgi:hypothetical protein